MINEKIENYNIRFLSILVSLVPFALITGPLVPDIILSFSAFIFLLLIKKNEIKNYFFNKFTIIFLIFYFYILFLSLISKNYLLSLESTLFYFRFWFFVLATIYCLKKDLIFIKIFYFFLFFTILFIIIDCIIQIIFGYNITFNKVDYRRLSGIFGDERVLGSYLVRTFPLLLALYFHDKIYKNLSFFSNSKFLFFLVFSSMVLILMSGERSSIGLMLIFIFVCYFLLKFSYKIKTILLSLVFIFFAILLYFNNRLFERLSNFTYKQFFSESGFHFFSPQHEVIFKTAIKIFKDNTFFGIGPKLFREICFDYPTYTIFDNTVNGCQSHPHNIYLQLLAETGIIGFLFIFMFFLIISFEILKKIFYNKSNNYYSSILALCVFINLWPFFPTGNFFNNWMSMLYVLPLGFLLGNKIK